MSLRVVCALSLFVALASRATVLHAQGTGGVASGKVTNVRNGQGIAGATITVEGSELATTSGPDGTYRIIRLSVGQHALTVRALGFAMGHKVVAIAAGATATADFPLQFSAANLQQIVVTGTAGDQTRAAQGATIASVDVGDLNTKAPIATVTETLQGRVAGVAVTNGAGTSGTSARITIRGPASISLSDAPIVFIDGVRMDAGQRNNVQNFHGLERLGGQSASALDDLNPDDIESIEIVKGPAAATLYGADASAGVIQIITKKGKLGNVAFHQSVTGEWNQISPNFTPYSVFGTCTSALIGTGGPDICQGKTAGTVVSDNPLVRNNIFRDGNLGALSYSGYGGTDAFGYYMSASAKNEQGTTPNNYNKWRNGRANMHWVITPQLSVDATAALSKTDYEIPTGDDSQYGFLTDGQFESSPFAVTIGPNGVRSGGSAFALQGLEAIHNEITTQRFTPTAQIQYQPFSWLSNRVTLGGDFSSTHAVSLFPPNDQGWYSGDQANGYVEDVQNPVNVYTVDYLGNIRAKFGRAGWITSNLSFGSQYIDITNNQLTGVGLGLATTASPLVSSASTSESHQTFTESKSLGLLVQEGLGFDDVLFVQGGFRVDENSAFGQSFGWFFLPKVSGSYVISQEPFWRSLQSTVSTLRLRAAYGETGRSPTPGASLTTYAPFPFVNGNGSTGPGVVPFSPGNAGLKPERGTEFETGIDAGFLQDRFGFELTYFNKRSTNLLLLQPIAPSLAFTSQPFVNAGTVDNSGLEFTVRATPISQRIVQWDVAFTGNTLRNNLVSLGANTIPNTAFLSPDLTQRFATGNPLASLFSSKIIGVNTQKGFATVTDQPVYDGPQFPTFQANVNTTVTLWHTLKLYGLLTTQRGGKIINAGQYIYDLVGISSQTNLPAGKGGYTAAQKLERFGPFQTADGTPVGGVLDAYVQRTDYTRLSELSATLMIPSWIARKLHGDGASITFGGRNLYLWKAGDYQGFDPDILSSTALDPSNPASQQVKQLSTVEEFTVPPTRRWFVRMNLQF